MAMEITMFLPWAAVAGLATYQLLMLPGLVLAVGIRKHCSLEI